MNLRSRFETTVWARIGKTGRAALLVGVGLAAGAAAVAGATVPDSTGALHGCYAVGSDGITPDTATANLRIIDRGGGQTCNTTPSPAGANERAIDWNLPGPAGVTGSAGPGGQQAPAGTTLTATAGGRNTLLLAGGQVIALVPAPGGGETLPDPAPPPGGGFGQMVLGSGHGAVTFGITRLSLGVTHGGVTTGSGRGASGKTTFHELSVSRDANSGAVHLSKAADDGFGYKTATLTLYKKGGSAYLRYDLSGVYVTGIEFEGFKGDSLPQETITLAFTSVKIEYFTSKTAHRPPALHAPPVLHRAG